jgi:hypothetical protein
VLGGERRRKPPRHGEVEDDRDLVVGCRRDRDGAGGHDKGLLGPTEPPSGVARGGSKVLLLALEGEGEGGEEGWLPWSGPRSKREGRSRSSHREHDLARERVRGTAGWGQWLAGCLKRIGTYSVSWVPYMCSTSVVGTISSERGILEAGGSLES